MSKMGHTFFLLFFSLLITSGVCTLTLVASQNPVAVGSNVTISLKGPITVTIGTWLFGPSILFLWFPTGQTIVGSGYTGGMSFNNRTYQLSLTSVSLQSSGLYALQSVTPVRDIGQISLQVQVPVSNVACTVSKTNLVEFNDSVTFTCSAQGTPVWYSWKNGSSALTNGSGVQIGSNGQLTINNVTRFDQGPFTCVVANNVSKLVSQQMMLNISYGPYNATIKVSPQKRVYISGSDITLSCAAVSRPAASFGWTYNNNPLNHVTPTLVLSRTSQSQSGQYTCVAQNAITMRFTPVTQTIEILDPISSAEVIPSEEFPIDGTSFSLNCSVTGPDASVQWMKNGVYLSAGASAAFTIDNATLTFNQLNISDDGQYQCDASNPVSNLTSPVFHLMVNYGPFNTVISGPTMAAAGSSVTFVCLANCYPQCQFSWFVNNSAVAQGSQYQIGDLALNSSGVYMCSAYNNITATSNNASLDLTVIAPISQVTINAENEPILNMSFTLTCNASGDVTDMQWMWNGTVLSSDSHITLSSDNTSLTFSSLSLSDDGDYECTASNAVSNMTSPPYDLLTCYGPVNTEISGPSMAETGSSVNFSCSAACLPACQYTWYYNDSEVDEGSQYETGALTLNSSGVYTCSAYNNISGNSANVSVELTVIEAISVFVTSSPAIPMASENVELICNVTGPYNSIYWIQNNQTFEPPNPVFVSSNNATVTFEGLETADDGEYQCVVLNSVREHFSQPYRLVANFGPSTVDIIVDLGDPTELTCVAVSEPKSVYQWILNDNSIVGNQASINATISSILISNYTCVARNPLTNHTASLSHVFNDAAVALPSGVMLTTLLALLLHVLDH